MSDKLFERYAHSSENVPVESEIRRLYREVEEYIYSVAQKRYDAKNTFRFNYSAMTDCELSAAWSFFIEQDIDVNENISQSQWMINRGDVIRKLNLAGKKVNSTKQYLLYSMGLDDDNFQDIAIFIGDLSRDEDKNSFEFLFNKLGISENYKIDLNKLINTGYSSDEKNDISFGLKKLPTYNLTEEIIK